MGLSEVEFCSTQNTGKFASLTKRARSTLFLLISSFNILLRPKKRAKKPEMGDFHVSKLLFLRVQIFFVHLFALRFQITVTKLFNQIWVYDVIGVAYWMSRFVVVCTESSQP